MGCVSAVWRKTFFCACFLLRNARLQEKVLGKQKKTYAIFRVCLLEKVAGPRIELGTS